MLKVGETLEWVSDSEEAELITMLRQSYHRGRTPSGHLALKLNQLYSYLGPVKTKHLHALADQCHVGLDDTMSRKDADRLWEHLQRTYREWDDPGIPM